MMMVRKDCSPLIAHALPLAGQEFLASHAFFATHAFLASLLPRLFLVVQSFWHVLYTKDEKMKYQNQHKQRKMEIK